MTLLEAAESLAIVELSSVSWINVHSLQEHHRAVFVMALLLPLNDPRLPAELYGGALRFWPDQNRVLGSPAPIEDQISELHGSRLLGNLASIRLRSPPLWIIEAHAGSREERLGWLRSAITMEGRSPIP